jgi:hypothetical protein
MQLTGMRFALLLAACALSVPWAAPTRADVLPDDRADVLFHRYDGGGLVVEGPSVLVQKKVTDKFAVNANYYVDQISSASIDVVTTASPYREKRQQESVGFEYLEGPVTYSGGFIDSNENDYSSKTAFATVSQSMFGDLTTLSIGFKRTWNNVYRSLKDEATGDTYRDPGFHQQNENHSYTLGLTQILSRNLIGTFDFETDIDQGYLSSPYRQVRYLISGALGTPTAILGTETQKYPNTRTSNAASLGLKYYLPYHAAIDGSFRYFHDTWAIGAETLQLHYAQPVWHHWLLEGFYRYYRQNAANFYQDVFARIDEYNYYTRDKELSKYQANTLGIGLSYQFLVPRVRSITKATANLRVDHMLVKYADFRDERYSKLFMGGDGGHAAYAGGEPLYVLNATILQAFFSVWF